MYSREASLKHWKDAKPNEGFVFVTLMQNEDICIGVMESFLQIEIAHIVYLKAEENIDENVFSKGIQLDVYVKDNVGTIYNVEMHCFNG